MKNNKRSFVNICCVTYNHEKFISQAIESFLMQKTDFPIEILIHDDASTDATISILKKYQKKYPNIIRLFLEKENQYSKGITKINPTFLFPNAKGKYIALCEGDDYWTDPYKLQKQVNFMDKNQDYSICSHNVIVRDETWEKIVEHEWLGKDHRQISTIEDILKYGSGGATCSLLFKRSAFSDYPTWTKPIKGGDWLLQILCTQNGKMRYFTEVMGVYRRHKYNSLYAAQQKELAHGNNDIIGLPHKYLLEAVSIIDKNLGYKYHKEILNQYIYAHINLARETRRHRKIIPATKNYILYLFDLVKIRM